MSNSENPKDSQKVKMSYKSEKDSNSRINFVCSKDCVKKIKVLSNDKRGRLSGVSDISIDVCIRKNGSFLSFQLYDLLEDIICKSFNNKLFKLLNFKQLKFSQNYT